MKLTSQQKQTLKAFEKARRLTGTPRNSPAYQGLLEAGLVESGLRNLTYGDRDSLGTLQERASIYGRGHALDPVASAVRFLTDARGKTGTPGQIAQAVQRSAFPGRYDQRAADAQALLGGSYTTSSGGAPSPTTQPGGDRQALLLSYLASRGRPDALLNLAQGLRQTQQAPAPAGAYGPQHATTGQLSLKDVETMAQQMGLTITSTTGGKHAAGSYHYQGRAVDVAGTPQAMRQFNRLLATRYRPSITELFYQGPGGVNVKNGQRVPQGFVSGHTDHVHIAI